MTMSTSTFHTAPRVQTTFHPAARRSRPPAPGRLRTLALCLGLGAVLLSAPTSLSAASAALLGWSDEGLHEIDGVDSSVYSLMPPYSTLHAQLVVGGKLVTNGSEFSVTYEAVADAEGSLNSSSIGKGNFYEFGSQLFEIPLAPDAGLAGFNMPGLLNEPQPMTFDPPHNGFVARGLPVLPYDDAGRPNRFPRFRLVARDSGGQEVASTDLSLPVSDRKSCAACHASGTQEKARPAAGWAWDCDPERDYKLNILRNHDEHYLAISGTYTQALAEAGYNRAGLHATVTADHRPVLCIRCHVSNAIPGSGRGSISPLTLVMHLKHAFVSDPDLGTPLSQVNESSTCFRCHAGPEKHFLRGAHRALTATNGVAVMNCQACHGRMTDVGRAGRKGWHDEPQCQSCHTGTADRNNGQIRYNSVFDTAGQVRQAVSQVFGVSRGAVGGVTNLFRDSYEHGGMACAACHGTGHAESPSGEAGDSLQPEALQQTGAVLMNCLACHTSEPATVVGGPHGMHPVSQNWVSHHNDLMGGENNAGQCRSCHGLDYRGTVLSRSALDHTVSGRGTRHYWPGYQVGCYDCHSTPTSDHVNTNLPPAVADVVTQADAGGRALFTLRGTSASLSALLARVIDPPAHGRVNLNGDRASYFPEPGFVGTDSFTYAAGDGSKESELGHVEVTVSPVDCQVKARALVPRAAWPGTPVPLRADASLAGCQAELVYDWDFGDGSPHGGGSSTCRSYASVGDYTWTLTVSADGVSQIVTGVITISPTLGPPLALSILNYDFVMAVSWPQDDIPVSLEMCDDVGAPYAWRRVLEPAFADADTVNTNTYIFVSPGAHLFRVRRVP